MESGLVDARKPRQHEAYENRYSPSFQQICVANGIQGRPPVTITPFLTRLHLSRYDYIMKDLSLSKVASGRASEIMSPRNRVNGAGRI